MSHPQYPDLTNPNLQNPNQQMFQRFSSPPPSMGINQMSPHSGNSSPLIHLIQNPLTYPYHQNPLPYPYNPQNIPLNPLIPTSSSPNPRLHNSGGNNNDPNNILQNSSSVQSIPVAYSPHQIQQNFSLQQQDSDQKNVSDIMMTLKQLQNQNNSIKRESSPPTTESAKLETNLPDRPQSLGKTRMDYLIEVDDDDYTAIVATDSMPSAERKTSQARQPETTVICRLTYEAQFHQGCLITANRDYICHTVKNHLIRVRRRSNETSFKLHGHIGTDAQAITDLQLPLSSPSDRASQNVLLSVGTDGQIFLWDLEAETESESKLVQLNFQDDKFLLARWRNSDHHLYNGICRHFATSTHDKIYLWNYERLILHQSGKDASDSTPINPLDVLTPERDIINLNDHNTNTDTDTDTIASMDFSADGRLLAVSTHKGRVRFYDFESRELLHEWIPHIPDAAVQSVFFVPVTQLPNISGRITRYLLTGGEANRQIKLWRFEDDEGRLNPPECLQTITLTTPSGEHDDHIANHLIVDRIPQIPSSAFVIFVASIYESAFRVFNFDAETMRLDYTTRFDLTQPILSFFLDPNDNSIRSSHNVITSTRDMFCIWPKGVHTLHIPTDIFPQESHRATKKKEATSEPSVPPKEDQVESEENEQEDGESQEEDEDEDEEEEEEEEDNVDPLEVAVKESEEEKEEAEESEEVEEKEEKEEKEEIPAEIVQESAKLPQEDADASEKEEEKEQEEEVKEEQEEEEEEEKREEQEEQEEIVNDETTSAKENAPHPTDAESDELKSDEVIQEEGEGAGERKEEEEQPTVTATTAAANNSIFPLPITQTYKEEEVIISVEDTPEQAPEEAAVENGRHQVPETKAEVDLLGDLITQDTTATTTIPETHHHHHQQEEEGEANHHQRTDDLETVSGSESEVDRKGFVTTTTATAPLTTQQKKQQKQQQQQQQQQQQPNQIPVRQRQKIARQNQNLYPNTNNNNSQPNSPNAANNSGFGARSNAPPATNKNRPAPLPKYSKAKSSGPPQKIQILPRDQNPTGEPRDLLNLDDNNSNKSGPHVESMSTQSVLQSLFVPTFQPDQSVRKSPSKRSNQVDQIGMYRIPSQNEIDGDFSRPISSSFPPPGLVSIQPLAEIPHQHQHQHQNSKEDIMKKLQQIHKQNRENIIPPFNINSPLPPPHIRQLPDRGQPDSLFGIQEMLRSHLDQQAEMYQKEKEDRSRFESQLISTVSQSLESIKKENLQNFDNLSRSLFSRMDATVAQTLQETHRKFQQTIVTRTEAIIKETIEKAIPRNFSAEIQKNLQDSIRQNFQKSFIPAIEVTCQKMFEQMNTTLKEGMGYIQSNMQQTQVQAQPILMPVQPVQPTQHTVISSAQADAALHQLQTSAETLTSISSSMSKSIIDSQQAFIAFLQNQAQQNMRLSANNSTTDIVPVNNLENIRHTINACINAQQYHEAFRLALCAENLEVLIPLIRRMDLKLILGGHSSGMDHMSKKQTMVLSLIQQLAFDLSRDTQLKSVWLKAALLILEPANHEIVANSTQVLLEVRQKIDLFIKSRQSSDQNVMDDLKTSMHITNSYLLS